MTKICGLILSVLLFVSSPGFSEVRLPRLISNGMVLQREAKINIWGWASPAERISITFRGKDYHTQAGNDGKWLLHLPPQVAGGPYEMTLTASNEIVLKDILFGDVWICSGQSNMELSMARVREKYPEAISNANNPNIRQFVVPDRYNFQKPNDDLESGNWKPLNPEAVLDFSAVAYFFANEIYSEYKVPIGLINAALGGSPAEAWISEEAIRKFPLHYNECQKFKDKELITKIEGQDRKVSDEWYSLLNRTDEGIKHHWTAPAFDDNDWDQMHVPGFWADSAHGKVNGSVWFRKEFYVPGTMIAKPAKLLLGRIVDADSVFINGIFVGTTGYQYPPRRYILPATILKEGTNSISVRVINHSGKGGFVPDKPYEMIVGNQSIRLNGIWKYRLGAKMDELAPPTFIRWKPIGLFNAMIAPLLNYTIKGAIWYQGEANTNNPGEYTELMRTLITDWRTQWKQGEFPFLFVQLANFMETKTEPSESNWAALRQAQLNTLSVPNTGMAVTIDIGEWNDIHPLNKKDVGIRLALHAKRLAYGNKKIIYSGPLYRSMKNRRHKIIINFGNTGKGLLALDRKELRHFSIAGHDKKFVWAKAEIKGNRVIVWNETVANPIAVRYAWADNPEEVNLYNESYLPASPFEAKKDY